MVAGPSWEPVPGPKSPPAARRLLPGPAGSLLTTPGPAPPPHPHNAPHKWGGISAPATQAPLQITQGTTNPGVVGITTSGAGVDRTINGNVPTGDPPRGGTLTSANNIPINPGQITTGAGDVVLTA